MKRITAVCEELFLTSTSRVDEQERSGTKEESETNAAVRTNSDASSRHSTTGGTSGGGSMRVRSLPTTSERSAAASSTRKVPSSRGTSVKSNSSRRVPDRREGLTNNGVEQRSNSSSYPRSQSHPKAPRLSNGRQPQRPVGGKYRAQSLSINPSLCEVVDVPDEVSPREIQGLHRKSVPLRPERASYREKGTNGRARTRERAISVDSLRRQDNRNRFSAPALKAPEKKDRSPALNTQDSRSSHEKRSSTASQRPVDASEVKGHPEMTSQDSLAPRLPQTSSIEASPRRRSKSERVEPFHSGSSNGSRTVSQPRHLGRAGSLRNEGVSILPSIFSRGRLLSWPMGVSPQVVYAAETSHELDDGHGAAGLSATLLCKMGAKHREWDVVRVGDEFCIRVVGWYGAELRSAPGREDARNVVYSVLHKDGETQSFSINGGPAQVHDERSSSDFSGYHYISERLGAVVSCSSGMDQVGLTVGLWTGGGSGESQSSDMQGEVRWRVLENGESEAGGHNGATLMRFGYYFFLDSPCATRLFTNTDTPEHVRLVARRASDGTIDEEASKQLTYIVVRVSAD